MESIVTGEMYVKITVGDIFCLSSETPIATGPLLREGDAGVMHSIAVLFTTTPGTDIFPNIH